MNYATMITSLITIGIHLPDNKDKQPKPHRHRGRAPSYWSSYAESDSATKRNNLITAMNNIGAIITTINALDVTILPDCGIAIAMSTRERMTKRLYPTGRPAPTDMLTAPPSGSPPPGTNSCVSYAAELVRLGASNDVQAGTLRMGIASAINLAMNNSVIIVPPLKGTVMHMTTIMNTVKRVNRRDGRHEMRSFSIVITTVFNRMPSVSAATQSGA